MSVYIGVVGSELFHRDVIPSIMSIERDDADGAPVIVTACKGYESRQMHFDAFVASGHDHMLLLDGDMIFAPNTLALFKKLALPFASGFYLRRSRHLLPVWYGPSADGLFPFPPFTEVPHPAGIYELGASGWGCTYIAREVVEATRAVLRGEGDVIEDDMDVWPYDLAAVMRGEETLRPLTGGREVIGSDIRYAFYARAAGYPLYGVGGITPQHLLQYPLAATDYTAELAAAAAGAVAETYQRRQAEFAAVRMAVTGERLHANTPAGGLP